VATALHFTGNAEADELLGAEPLALLVGFVLDQQVTVQKAFEGPLALQERLGSLDAGTLAAADLEPVFRTRPAIHRFPGAMAQRVHDLAMHVLEHYDGDAARVWTDAADADALRANLMALPGFGEMKVKALGAVLAKRVRDLAAHVAERYDGDAARVWTDAGSPDELRANLQALPGFGEMKVKAIAAVLAKRFGVEHAEPLVPNHPTLGDVDSAQALHDYQGWKREHKASLRA